MIHPTLILLKSDLKSYEIMLLRKYKEQIRDCTDIVILQTSDKMRKYKISFETIENPKKNDEIFYFKHIKSKLLAILYLCNYIKIFERRILKNKPCKIERYYFKKLSECQELINQYDLYYSYFITKASHSDDKYFLRTTSDVVIALSNEIIEIDCRSNTPYVFYIGKSEALYHYKKYLQSKIIAFIPNDSMTSNLSLENLDSSTLNWTYSKTELVELIYALHTAGTFNDGKATIKMLIEAFQALCNIDLSNHNRIFYDIKQRKTLKTKHIDHLKRELLRKITRSDNQLFR